MDLLGAVTLAPMLLGLFFIIGAATLGENHQVLRIFLFLLSLTTFWFSMNIGLEAVASAYAYDGLETMIARSVNFSVISFIVIGSYFMAYFLWYMVTTLAKKRRERLEY